MSRRNGGSPPPPPHGQRVKRLVPVEPSSWIERYEPLLPRINAAITLILLLVMVGWRHGAPSTDPMLVYHDLQHVRETLRSQQHRQIRFNIHPREIGQVLRHPTHERDFITELDLLELQDYRLCCAWADKFICDEQRVRAEVHSTEGHAYLSITSFIGSVDAHCTFSWTTTGAGMVKP